MTPSNSLFTADLVPMLTPHFVAAFCDAILWLYPGQSVRNLFMQHRLYLWKAVRHLRMDAEFCWGTLIGLYQWVVSVRLQAWVTRPVTRKLK